MEVTANLAHVHDAVEFSNIAGPPGIVRWRDSGRDMMIFVPLVTDGFNQTVMRAHLDVTFYIDAIR